MLLLSLLAVVVFLLGLFIILFIFGLINISVDIRYIGGKPDFTIKVLLWKIRLLTIRSSQMKMGMFPFKFLFRGKIDALKKDLETTQSIEGWDIHKILEKWESVSSKIKKESNLTHEILNLFRIHNIKWVTTLGLEDAPLTAFSVGIVWAVKYNVLGRLLSIMKGMERPAIDVRPAYQEMMFQTHITCIISFRIGKAIHTARRIAKIRKRRQVGKCQSIQYKA